MTRKQIILIVLNLLLLTVVFVLFKTIKTRQRTQKLNLILISVDTLRPDHMGIYGYKKNTTPNIDKFFKKSYKFTNVYTSTPKTYASMVSIMTGLSPASTRIYDYLGRPLTSKEVTITEYLSSQGYHNAAYIMNSSLVYSNRNTTTKLEKGFEKYRYLAPIEIKGKNAFYSHSESINFVNEGSAFIKENTKGPFFIWFHLIDPHAPYSPPNSPIDKYVAAQQREKYRGLPNGCFNPEVPPESIISKLTYLYDQEVRFSDSLIKEIFKTLKKQKLQDNTIVVLTADHGEGFDHKYYFHHGSLYESNVRIPLLIKIPKGIDKQIKTRVLNFDFAPTFLDLLGIKYSSSKFDGLSLVPLIKGDEKGFAQYKRNIFGYNHSLQYFSIFNGEYKYFYSAKKACLATGASEELYNLTEDPKENKLLQNSSVIKEKLKRKLLKHLAEKNIVQVN